MKLITSILIVFITFINVYSNIIHVPVDYQKIQLAIDAAQDGDTIIVSHGRYYENLDFKGKGIIVASNFLFSQNLNDIDSTIIDGSQPVSPDTASCVLMVKSDQSFSDDSSAALIGFTIRGGKGTVWEDEHGLGNFYREGGGILIQYWAPRILFNIIKENEAYNKIGVLSSGGGAIRCGDGNPTISNNIIMNNKARYGGAIVMNYSGVIINNNIIAFNSGGEDFGGGGIWILGNRFDSKIKVIENNTIVNNASTTSAGGIYLWLSSNNYIHNNILWDNTAPSSSQIRIRQSSGQIIYNDVQGGLTGTGNINLSPEFLDSNYILSDNSPCIDAGHDSSVFNDPENLTNLGFALFPSKGTIRNDIGAFGGPKRRVLPNIVTAVKNESNSKIPEGFILFQNYPNPFNPSTKINWQPPVSGRQILKVFDVLGNELVTLVDEYKPAGSYEVEFNGSKLASGIYYYQLRVGEYVQTKKMILLR